MIAPKGDHERAALQDGMSTLTCVLTLRESILDYLYNGAGVSQSSKVEA